ncbi:MAG: GerAB/ArcD/ProY family transporter [bacterium]|jgi:spore germination protein
MKAMPENKKLTSFQMFTFLSGIIIGTGILSLPRVLAEIAGHDLWLSLLLAGGLVSGSGVVIVLICRRFPEANVFEISEILLGRIAGKTIILYYIVFSLAGAVVVTRVFADLARTYSFLQTPRALFAALLVLLAAYILRHDLIVLARYSELVFYLLFPTLAFYFLEFDQINFLNFLPIGAAGTGNIVRAVLPSLYSFFGFEFMVVFHPYLQQPKSDMKIMGAVIAVVLLSYLLSVFAIIGYFGEIRAISLNWPVLNYLKNIRLPFFDRVEQLFLFLWLHSIIITISGTLLVAVQGITHLLRLRHHKFTLPVVIPLLFAMTFLPANITETYKAVDVVSYASIGGMFIIPILLYLTAWVRGGKAVAQK